MQAIIKLLKNFGQAKKGVSNVIVVMLSLILIVIIVSNVILWSYQMNQLDLERMQEKVQITDVARTAYSPWFTAQEEFSTLAGSILNGSYTDTKFIDDFHETFTGETTEGVTYTYNPSAYSPFGFTKLVSGSITDLQTEDNVYMRFRSYTSATSATSKTDAFIAYRSNTGTGMLSSPKFRFWDGDTGVWGEENEMATADSPVRWVRVATCPKSERALEKIVVTLSDDGFLDAYVFDGTSWIVTNNIGSTGTVANNYRCFDVAYEKTSGRALLVYSRGTTTDEIGYKIWTFDSGWSNEYLLNLTYTTGRVNWVSLTTAPGTRPETADDNEIAMIYIDSNSNVYGYVWNGSSWDDMGATAVWDTATAIATRECIAVAYEQQSGRAMFVWGDATATDNYYRIWDGSTLSGPTLGPDIPAQGGITNWITLKPNPSSNELMFLVVDGGSDLNTAYWNGSAWTVHTEHDNAVDTNTRRCADFAWEPTGSKGLLVWGTNNNQISYKTFTVPNTWTSQANVQMSGRHYWVQLRTNPRSISGDVKILGAVLNSNYNLGAITWDGLNFAVISASTFTANTNTNAYECFEIEFQNFGDPTEFTSEVEFTGTSNTETWGGLVWAVDCSLTTTNVNVTFQLFNYEINAYPTSGDGYLTDIIGTIDVTKNQTISANSTHYRSADGEWKLKIKCVKATEAPFEFNIDWVELKAIFGVCQIDICNYFVIDLSQYPLNSIQNIEILVRYKVTNSEKWFIKAYNWTATIFSNLSFNNTEGNEPAPNEWNNYAISITKNWIHYVEGNGTVLIEFVNEGTSQDQTILEIDFFGVRATISKASFTFKNYGSLTTHIVALWVINQIDHERYDVNLFINAGEELIYTPADIRLPEDKFTVKIVTERGNIAVFTED